MPVTATTSTARRARTEKRRTASSLARRAVSASTTSPPIQAPTASRCTTSRGRNSQRGARPVSCAPSASVTTGTAAIPNAPPDECGRGAKQHQLDQQAAAGGGRGGQKRAHRAGTEPADGGRAGSHLPGQGGDDDPDQP